MFNLLLAFALSSVTPTPAETKTSSEQSSKAAKEERKICKRIGTTSTRLGAEKVCMTAAEWKKQQQSY